MVTRMITVLDPTAKSVTKEIKMADRYDKLANKVLGVIWNSKPGGDIFLNELGEQLNKRFHFAEILKHQKFEASIGISEDILSEFSKKCDLVIVGVAD